MGASTTVAAGVFATSKGSFAGVVATGWAVGVVTIPAGVTAACALGLEPAPDPTGGTGRTSGSFFPLSAGAGGLLRTTTASVTSALPDAEGNVGLLIAIFHVHAGVEWRPLP
jgi:hypothetical protein